MKQLLLLILLLALPGIATGQGAPAKGMVWRIPADAAQAVRDLQQMRQIGVEAVRTDVVWDERLLAAADTLGLRLYQDLPVAYAPAGALADSLAEAAAILDQALVRARAHPSARHFGLARIVDTSDPAACAYFEELAGRVRRSGLAGAQVYYETTFVQSDRCGQTVDFVLLDVRDTPRPERILERWRARHGEVPAGVGAVGTWVRDDTARGLRVPHSPEVQARYLEDALHTLVLDTAGVVPPVVFVYRWRDVVEPFPSPAFERVAPGARPYGLLAADGTPRPGLDVVRGIYTGRQTVFAFEAGRPPEPRGPWLIFLGWGVVVMLGLYYALVPRFRHMVPRYFRAHNFYQDAVREGRDVLFGASVVLLVALSAAAGITAYVVLQAVRAEEAFVVLFRWAPLWLQEAGLTVLAQPWGLVALVATGYALGMVLWAALLSGFSRRRYALTGGQALMLALFPRWPLLLVMAAAMAVPGLEAGQERLAALVLAGCWLAITCYALLRTLYDYYAVTRVPLYVPFVMLVCSPLALAALVLLAVALQAHERALFFWHLATRA